MLHRSILLDYRTHGAIYLVVRCTNGPFSPRKVVMAKTEKTETSANGFFDVTKALGDFRLPGLDVEAIVATQRKNLEALTQANQLAIEGVRALAQRQAEIAQQAFEKGLADVRELSELTAKASTDVCSVIARRVSESFDEARLYAKKQSSANQPQRRRISLARQRADGPPGGSPQRVRASFVLMISRSAMSAGHVV